MTEKRISLEQTLSYVAFVQTHKVQIEQLLSLKDDNILSIADVESRVITPVL